MCYNFLVVVHNMLQTYNDRILRFNDVDNNSYHFLHLTICIKYKIKCIIPFNL